MKDQSLDTGPTPEKWVPINEEDIKAIRDINTAMSIVNLPGTISYWSKGLSQVSSFPSIMTVNRFDVLSKYLHLSEDAT